MTASSRCICIIGARAGSRRIPHKNREVVAGVPLYMNAVEAALNSHVCERVIVSTDDPVIQETLRQDGRVTLAVRPDALAGGQPSMWDVVADLMDREPDSFSSGAPLLLLTPCHPLRTGEHVREAHSLLTSREVKAVVSVTRYPCPPELALKEEGGLLTRDWTGLVRGADHPVSFYPNGAVTLLTQEAFREHRSPYTDKTVPYEMAWPECLDIDDPEDLVLARKLVELA